jgi:hypothetical protein
MKLRIMLMGYHMPSAFGGYKRQARGVLACALMLVQNLAVKRPSK